MVLNTAIEYVIGANRTNSVVEKKKPAVKSVVDVSISFSSFLSSY